MTARRRFSNELGRATITSAPDTQAAFYQAAGEQQNTNLLFDKTIFRGTPDLEWVQGEYEPNHLVLDGNWTMLSNKTTQDRPAPQPVGEPAFLSGLGDTPPWSDGNDPGASLLYTGFRYTVPAELAGWSLGSRIYGVPNTPYRTLVVYDPLGTPRTELSPAFTLDSEGWFTISTSSALLLGGDTIDFLLITAQSSPPATVVTYPYDYIYANGDPLPGEIRHQNNNHADMRVSHLDDNAVDRASDITAIKAGDTIDIDGQILYNVTAANHGALSSQFIVIPVARAPVTGVQDITFSIVVPGSLDYKFITDHYAAVPEVSGLFSNTSYDDITINNNGYATDVLLQEGVASDDWDVVAYSNFSQSSPGVVLASPGGLPAPLSLDIDLNP